MADPNQTPTGLAALVKKENQLGATPASGTATGPITEQVVQTQDGTFIDKGPVSDQGGSVVLTDQGRINNPDPIRDGQVLSQVNTLPIGDPTESGTLGAMIPTDTRIDRNPRLTQDDAELAIPIDYDDGEDQDFTYRHRTIRNFSIGQWEFENHILVVHGAKANRKFLDLLGSTPPAERANVVKWNPEVMKTLEQPVDYGIVRGAQSTGSIRDPKTNPGLSKPDPFAGFGRPTS